MANKDLKIAWRKLWSQKGLTLLHICGLALGLAACLLILLFVCHQLSYDRYHKNADRIVRVIFRGQMNGGGIIREAHVMPPVADALKHDFPEVLDATRIHDQGMPRIGHDGQVFKNNRMAFVDANFFQLFTIPLIKGNPATALRQPGTAVISRSMAKQYFGAADPLGKTLTFVDNHNATLQVTGVFEDIPESSHFHFGLLASMATWPDARSTSWMTSGYYTYLLLPRGYDYRKLEAKLPQETDKYMGPQLQRSMGVTMDQFRRSGNHIGLYLQPLTTIHLERDLSGDMEPHGNKEYVYIFSLVAAFILLIACVNFVNLSTAGASTRAREIGVRKVLGSGKSRLLIQFLTEALLTTALALLLALGLIYLSMPLFNQLTGDDLSRYLKPWMGPALLGITLATALLAGAYPAFYLSSLRPIDILRSRSGSAARGGRLRSGLVVFQFAMSIGLIIATLVVYNQLSFIRHKDPGYDKSQVLIIDNTSALGAGREAFRQSLLKDPRIAAASYSGYLPAGPSNSNNFLLYPDAQSASLVKTLRYEVDTAYIPALGMRMAGGRNFSAAYGADSLGIIVNEAAARAFGWTGNIEGHTLTHADNEGHVTTYHVIGMVQNFHFRSLHEFISPLVMTLGGDQSRLIVKWRGSDIAGLLRDMKARWESLGTGENFAYAFLDDRYNDMYKGEQNIGLMLAIFAALTVLVAAMGLFGLATFTTEQRRKEIGVRKVLGASVSGIVALMTRDFLTLVFLGLILACPLAWYVMHTWLEGFAYRIRIGWWIFPAAGLAALLVALATVSVRAAQAARANPVQSLRTE